MSNSMPPLRDRVKVIAPGYAFNGVVTDGSLNGPKVSVLIDGQDEPLHYTLLRKLYDPKFPGLSTWVQEGTVFETTIRLLTLVEVADRYAEFNKKLMRRLGGDK